MVLGETNVSNRVINNNTGVHANRLVHILREYLKAKQYTLNILEQLLVEEGTRIEENISLN